MRLSSFRSSPPFIPTSQLNLIGKENKDVHTFFFCSENINKFENLPRQRTFKMSKFISCLKNVQMTFSDARNCGYCINAGKNFQMQISFWLQKTTVQEKWRINLDNLSKLVINIEISTLEVKKKSDESLQKSDVHEKKKILQHS